MSTRVKIRRPKTLILLACALISLSAIFFACRSASAAFFYVDKDASGSRNGTSWTNAWTSFASINWSLIKPGDSLYISGGIYGQTYYETLEVKASGRAGQNIVVSPGRDAGHNGTVIIDGQNSRLRGLSLRGQKYVTLSGFKLLRHTHGDILIGGLNGSAYSPAEAASQIIVENMDITTQSRGIFVETSDNIILQHNSIQTVDYSAAETDGIYSQRNRDNIYQQNKITMRNSESTGHDDAIQLYTDRNATVRLNNIEVTNNPTGNAQGIFQEAGEGVSVYYANTIFMNMVRSNALVYNATNGSQGSVKMFNNLIVENHPNLENAYQSGIGLSGTSGSEIMNNLLYSSSANRAILIILKNNPLNLRIDYNLIYAPNASHFLETASGYKTWSEWQALGYDFHGLNINPLFVDAPSGNFRLQSQSPALGSGIRPDILMNISCDDSERFVNDQDIGPYVCQKTSPSSVTPSSTKSKKTDIKYATLWINDTNLYRRLKGKIILRVKTRGEAYYVSPASETVYYLGSPSDTFHAMKNLGIGISNRDLFKIPLGDIRKVGKNISKKIVSKYLGKIYLQVEAHGEAWYVNPADGKRYFLGRPFDSYNILKRLGLGISETDFSRLTR